MRYEFKASPFASEQALKEQCDEERLGDAMQSLATILLYAAYGIEVRSAWLINCSSNKSKRKYRLNQRFLSYWLPAVLFNIRFSGDPETSSG